MLKLILTIGLCALVVAIVWCVVSFFVFARAIDAERQALAAAAQPSGLVVTEQSIAALPEPVRRHLRQAGVLGKPVPRLVTLTQTGRIRNAPDAGWMAFTAEEVYSTSPPAFVWQVWFPNRSTPMVFGRDHYLDGDGRITMKLLGTVPVADIGGTPEMNEASLMRYLNEMMWFPAAFIGENLTWTPVDDTSADVTLTDRGMSATARLFFDGEGRLVNFRADRFNTNTSRMETWETPLDRQGSLSGLNLPISGKAVWQSETDPFAYIELEITGVSYE